MGLTGYEKKSESEFGVFDMARVLNFAAGGLIGEKLYVLTFDGILAEIHTRTGGIRFIYPHLPEGGNLQMADGALWCIPLKNRIYFAYNKFKMAAVLDLDSLNLTFRDIEMEEGLKSKRFFMLGYRDGEVYYHAASERKLVRVGLESLHGKSSDVEILQDEDVIRDYGRGIPDRKQYFCEKRSRTFVEYDFVEQRCSRTKIPEELQTVDCFTVKKNAAYVLARNGGLWQWDFKDGCLLKICDIEYRGNTNRISVLMTVAGPKLYVWPAYEDRIVCIDTRSAHEEAMGFPSDFDWPELPHNSFHRYNLCTQDERHIFIFPKTSNYMPVLSKKDGSVKWVDMRVPERDWIEYRMSVSNNLLFAEAGKDSLETYMRVLCHA